MNKGFIKETIDTVVFVISTLDTVSFNETNAYRGR